MKDPLAFLLLLPAILLLFFGCATVPLSQNVANKTVQLWGDVGTPGYLPPSVTVISAADMAAMRAAPHGWVLATYRCKEREMYVTADQAMDDDWLSGLLVHELTHHKQCIEGRMAWAKDMCPLEVEAYTAQTAWLNKRA